MNVDKDEIRRRWLDATSFYSERDHRTELEVRDLHAYASRRVEIHVDATNARDVTVQRITITAANLTARWARNVTVVVPAVPVTVPTATPESLGERILREMRAADPFGKFTVKSRLESASDGDAALRLFVGSCETAENVDDDYFVDASGWSARGRRGSDSPFALRRAATAPAAALAGAIGAADLFKRAVLHPRPTWLRRFEWSTWSHEFARELALEMTEPPVPAVADLGRVLLAGVGAIGSALLYILGLAPLAGEFTVVDRDNVDTSNLNRSPLFTALDAAVSRRKTLVAYSFLHGLGVETREVFGTWHEVGEPLSHEVFDVWVSLTNEDAAWAEVPYQLPPVVLHGTTTSGWGVAFGRHIPRLEDCTLCRLPRPSAQFRGPCAEGDIGPTAQPKGPRASLPFLSTIAAALIAAELMKLGLPGAVGLPNAVEGDLREGLPTVLAMFRRANPECHGCRIGLVDLWLERGGRGRHGALSARA